MKQALKFALCAALLLVSPLLASWVATQHTKAVKAKLEQMHCDRIVEIYRSKKFC